MPIAVSASILLIAAVVVAILLATTVIESAMEVALSTKIEMAKMMDLVLVTTLDKDGTTCVIMLVRADANTAYMGLKELEVAYYTEKTVSVKAAKKYGMVYEDPTSKTVVLNIDGEIKHIPSNSIANTICNLLKTSEAAILWFCAEKQIGICPSLPILVVLKTPQTGKLIVELKSPKTPAVKIRVR
ncbi:MAG TPA: hypothetical protein EYH26_00275 [Pyrodictium sp.]|nr:hypothetical protein [Pyrodictium sp.]